MTLHAVLLLLMMPLALASAASGGGCPPGWLDVGATYGQLGAAPYCPGGERFGGRGGGEAVDVSLCAAHCIDQAANGCVGFEFHPHIDSTRRAECMLNRCRINELIHHEGTRIGMTCYPLAHVVMPTSPRLPTPAFLTGLDVMPWGRAWSALIGFNCYNGNGAIDLADIPSIGTLAACKASCLADTSCEAVVMVSEANQMGYNHREATCYRRRDVRLGQCISSSQYTTHTIASRLRTWQSYGYTRPVAQAPQPLVPPGGGLDYAVYVANAQLDVPSDPVLRAQADTHASHIVQRGQAGSALFEEPSHCHAGWYVCGCRNSFSQACGRGPTGSTDHDSFCDASTYACECARSYCHQCGCGSDGIPEHMTSDDDGVHHVGHDEAATVLQPDVPLRQKSDSTQNGVGRLTLAILLLVVVLVILGCMIACCCGYRCGQGHGRAVVSPMRRSVSTGSGRRQSIKMYFRGSVFDVRDDASHRFSAHERGSSPGCMRASALLARRSAMGTMRTGTLDRERASLVEVPSYRKHGSITTIAERAW